MTTLLELSSELEKINDLIASTDDLPPENREKLTEAIADLLSEQSGIKKNISEKVDNYLGLIKNFQHLSEGRRKESERLRRLADQDLKKADFLIERLKAFFETHDLNSMDTRRFKIRLSQNGGKTPLIMDDLLDCETIPEAYQKVIKTPNKPAIRAALEKGEKLTFARLGNREKSLRIK